jgi:hypothetical protein
MDFMEDFSKCVINLAERKDRRNFCPDFPGTLKAGSQA